MAIDVIEAREDAATPYQAERGFTSLGEWTGAVCGGHMAGNMRIALIRKNPVVENKAGAVERIEKTVGVAFNVGRPRESDGSRAAEDLETRLDLTIPSVDDELIDVAWIKTVFRQRGDNCVEIVDGLVSAIVVLLLLLNAED
ncbi:hypothetical protein GGD54_005774 [Rhizobium tropici]|uniref:Uncharacterized protein n=1 Tax=Rhizobium lusitanum TaxID=293958 RepID=A0A7X0IYR1_9HYPH|nr:hypothetical protein [Rhizobium tropici]MBB5596343.1 hypothetical protein [Rhizobium tropici]MBB6489057.1 hypothetical protein [Rhizobium lusitanum]